jgi:hypothetical protein
VVLNKIVIGYSRSTSSHTKVWEMPYMGRRVGKPYMNKIKFEHI